MVQDETSSALYRKIAVQYTDHCLHYVILTKARAKGKCFLSDYDFARYFYMIKRYIDMTGILLVLVAYKRR